MKINGKNYNPAEITFNVICDLEDRGISLSDVQKKSMSMMRAYAALSMDMDNDKAGEEIQAHILGGGDFKEVAEVFGKEVEKSGFFRALKEKSEKETAKDTGKKSAAEAKSGEA